MVGAARLKAREDIIVLVVGLVKSSGRWNADVGKVCKSELRLSEIVWSLDSNAVLSQTHFLKVRFVCIAVYFCCWGFIVYLVC